MAFTAPSHPLVNHTLLIALCIRTVGRFEEQQANEGLKRAVEALWTSDEVRYSIHLSRRKVNTALLLLPPDVWSLFLTLVQAPVTVVCLPSLFPCTIFLTAALSLSPLLCLFRYNECNLSQISGSPDEAPSSGRGPRRDRRDRAGPLGLGARLPSAPRRRPHGDRGQDPPHPRRSGRVRLVDGRRQARHRTIRYDTIRQDAIDNLGGSLYEVWGQRDPGGKHGVVGVLKRSRSLLMLVIAHADVALVAVRWM